MMQLTLTVDPEQMEEVAYKWAADFSDIASDMERAALRRPFTHSAMEFMRRAQRHLAAADSATTLACALSALSRE